MVSCGLSHHALTSLEAPFAQLWPVGRSIAADLYGPAFLVVLQLQFLLLTGEAYFPLSLNPGMGVKLGQTPFSQVRDFWGILSIDYPGLSSPHLMWLLLVEMATELLAGMRQTHTLK